jgi:hypothetical protein
MNMGYGFNFLPRAWLVLQRLSAIALVGFNSGSIRTKTHYLHKQKNDRLALQL